MDSPSQTTCPLAVVTVTGRNIKWRPNLKVLQPRGVVQRGGPNM